MRTISKVSALLLVLFLTPVLYAADPKAGVEAFNHAMEAATRHMSNPEALALWEDDGVSLLPSTPPIAGKKAIGQFLDQVTAQLKGAHMQSFEMQCHDITVSGDWASEWCTEHQVVRFADPKQPPFDGRGTMLFVLHRGAGGQWRLKTEMWNQAAAPAK
jgi:ketosteroid isomerase-like protein